MQYDQFLAVMLTALGIILAALALLVGLAAIFGYQKISDIAAEEARKAAVSAAEEFFGGFPQQKPRTRRAASSKQVGNVRKSIIVTPQDTSSASEKEGKRIARKYPRKEESGK